MRGNGEEVVGASYSPGAGQGRKGIDGITAAAPSPVAAIFGRRRKVSDVTLTSAVGGDADMRVPHVSGKKIKRNGALSAGV